MRGAAAFAQQGAALVSTDNSHGQRVAKTANRQTTVFHYDQSGQLIAETNPSGTLKREYYYLNGQLFMLFDPATHTQYRLHPDHLGTVRLVTRSTLTPVWRWDSAPFGETLPDEDPDGDGQPFVFNLRFPGQYFDQETGLHYNYFRDYDPATGRYAQSDPIGLASGLNTYAYVGGNPLSFIDAEGLQIAVPAPIYPPVGGSSPGLGGYDWDAPFWPKPIRDFIDWLCADEQTVRHRGRIQAQGDGYEDSEAWDLPQPLTVAGGLAKLNTLVARMPKRIYQDRNIAIAKAQAWIKNASQAGGVSAFISKTFQNPGAKRGNRIDIEVIQGQAFVS